MQNLSVCKIIGIIVLVVIVVPLLVTCLIETPSPFSISDTSNVWIGFWGSYLGGILTLIGVVLTIRYSINQATDHRHDAVRPYLTLKQLYNTEYRNDVGDLKPWDYHLGVVGNMPYDEGDVIIFDEFTTFGEIKNIGLGTAVDVTLINVHINDFKLFNTNSYHALACNDKVMFQFYLFDLHINKLKLPITFKEGYEKLISDESLDIPELGFGFDMIYKDMYGKYYKQEVIYKVQVLEDYKPNIIGAQVHEQVPANNDDIKQLKVKNYEDN